MKTKSYLFHQDPGHGWLAVKRVELDRLGIAGDVSYFSYQNGKTVYLEEDCDAPLFLNAKKEKGETYEIRSSYKENTPIRRYDQFVPSNSQPSLV